MAKPRVPQNLPPESQQWVRDVERRLNDLEVQSQRLTRSVTQNAGQIDSISKATLAAYGAIPLASSSGQTRVGAGSLFVETKLDIPPTMKDFSVLTVATVTPASETGSGGGTLVDGDGVFDVFINGVEAKLSSTYVPRVTSDPLRAITSSALDTMFLSQDDSDPITEVSATLQANFYDGSPGQGGGYASIFIMAIPRRAD